MADKHLSRWVLPHSREAETCHPQPTYVPDNAWHSKPFRFHLSDNLLLLFDLRVKLSTTPPEGPVISDIEESTRVSKDLIHINTNNDKDNNDTTTRITIKF